TRLELDLRHFVTQAFELARADIERVAAAAGKAAPAIAAERVTAEIYDYRREPLREYCRGGGARASIGAAPMTTEMFDAVLASSPVSPLDFDARLNALRAFLDLPESASLTAANKRIA